MCNEHFLIKKEQFFLPSISRVKSCSFFKCSQLFYSVKFVGHGDSLFLLKICLQTHFSFERDNFVVSLPNDLI